MNELPAKRNAVRVSALALLMTTTAMVPAARADCAIDGSKMTCTGEITSTVELGLNPGDFDVTSQVVKNLTSSVFLQSGLDLLKINLQVPDGSGDGPDRTVDIDLSPGWWVTTTSGKILNTKVLGADAAAASHGGEHGANGHAGRGSGALTVSITADNGDDTGTRPMLVTHNNPLFQMLATGGNGGDGGDANSDIFETSRGGNAGDGAAGGDISVTVSEDVILSSISDGDAISITSQGGNGGHGGSGHSGGWLNSHGGDGGRGGDGGDVTLISTWEHNNLEGEKGNGIGIASKAGDGGDGGDASSNTDDYVGSGGDGGIGGDVTLTFSGNVAANAANAYGIYALSAGGRDGSEGSELGFLHRKGKPGSAGDPGAGGTVKVTLGTGNITTLGSASIGVMAQSIGGMGAEGGTSIGGLSGYGAGGGSGGGGGVVSLVLKGTQVGTSGDQAIGVVATSVGGGGGTGGSALDLKAMGGFGGTGGNGDAVSVTLDDARVGTGGDHAEGVVALSVGGTGGNSGYAMGLKTTGASGGNGGDGGTVTLDMSGSTILTSGNENAGILGLSVGGGGGNSHSGAGIESIGASGGVGGNAGSVTYTSKVDAEGNGTTVRTSGDKMAQGIVLASVGKGGGTGSSTHSIDVLQFTTHVGGAGGGGGTGGDITFTMSEADVISTLGKLSEGFVALSVGGGGGASGADTTITLVNASSGHALGGEAGDAANGGDITGSTLAGIITTAGELSAGAVIASVGQGGGLAGSTTSVNLLASFSNDVGSDGGAGGDGGEIDVTSTATITTGGDLSEGLLAFSVGGSGGRSSHVTNFSSGLDLSGATAAATNGMASSSAGGGGDSSAVTVANSGAIRTSGHASAGVAALSVAGSGGVAGSTWNGAVGGLTIGATTGSNGGNGGTSGNVTVTNAKGGTIATGVVTDAMLSGLSDDDAAALKASAGALSPGILAVSVAGGGGNTSHVFSGAISGINANFAQGGAAGTGGKAGSVSVTHDGLIRTNGALSFGVLALSVGGGGGSGGTVSTGAMGMADLGLSLGSNAGDGGTGGTVTVIGAGSVATAGHLSAGIAALSVGGKGGTGGAVDNVTLDMGEISGNVQAVQGGNGGKGGTGGKVTVSTTADGGTQQAGTITTTGYGAAGILGLSLGGNGGFGGTVTAGNMTISTEGSLSAEFLVGGHGGTGGKAGDVGITNVAGISTQGAYAMGIAAASAGGNGGMGGSSYYGTISGNTGTTISAAVTVGGDGGTGGAGGAVTVDNSGSISTRGGDAYGIYANSIGGHGGNGGTGISYNMGVGEKAKDKVSFALKTSVGGSGGKGAVGGDVTVTNSGAIATTAGTSYGIFGHSIGGNGGNGASTGSYNIGLIAEKHAAASEAAKKAGEEEPEAPELDYEVNVGGSGGAGGKGGTVTLANAAGGSIVTGTSKTDLDGDVVTTGAAAYGMFGQSIGGNGGNGGNGDPDGVGFAADAYDAYENFNTAKEQIEQYKKLFGKAEWKEKLGDLFTNWSVSIGGSSGDSAVGGDVILSNDGSITTYGDSATGIYGQSVGGGGGVAGDGSQGLLTSVGVAGSTGKGGDSGDITITNTGHVTTGGDGAMGIYAQAVGGGGGTAGEVEAGIVTTLSGIVQSVGRGMIAANNNYEDNDGAGGDGGAVTVSLGKGSSIATAGRYAHGVWAQSVGGGGGGQGNGDTDKSVDPENPSDADKAARGQIGTGQGAGSSGLVNVDVKGDITVTGYGASGVFAQSVAGYDDESASAGVLVKVDGSISAQGDDARAILVQADGAKDNLPSSADACSASHVASCASTSHVVIGKGALVETTSANAYETVAFAAGKQNFRSSGALYVSNLLQNAGTLQSADDDAVVIGNDGTASLRIHNQDGGVLNGSIKLGDNNRNEFTNASGATFGVGTNVQLGNMGYYTGSAGGTLSAGTAGTVGNSQIDYGGTFSEAGTIQVDMAWNGSTLSYDKLMLLEVSDDASGTLSGEVATNLTGKTALENGSFFEMNIIQYDPDSIDVSDLGIKHSAATKVNFQRVANAEAFTFTSLQLEYEVDYSASSTGHAMSRAALKYADYFSNTMGAIANGGVAEGAATDDLQYLATQFLNTGSAAELEQAYLKHVPDEASVAGSTAARSALAMHGLLQSCPVLDPAAGTGFLHQQDCGWMEYIGAELTQDATSQAPGYTEKTWGLAGAVQREIHGDLFLEVGATYEDVTITGSNFTQAGSRFGFGAALKKEIGAVTLSTTLAGGFYDFDYNRGYTVTGQGYNAASDITGRYLSLEARASSVYQQDSFYLKPSAALAVTRIWQDGFTESGGGSLNWDVDAVAETNVDFSPMVEVGHATSFNGNSAVAYLRAGVTAALTDPEYSVTSALAGADTGLGTLSNVVTGDRYRGNLAVGLDMDLADRLTVSVRGEAGLSENSRAYGGLLRLSYRF